MKSGNKLWVDPIISDTDFIITTGVIVPHYFAGFSGGRKSILPGICGRKTIESNHSNMFILMLKLETLEIILSMKRCKKQRKKSELILISM